MTDHEHEPDWSVKLRRQPASLSTGRPEGDTSTFEVICRECGDDLGLDYQEVSSELRRIRGPYPLMAGIAAFLKHGEYHDRAEETGTRHVRPDLTLAIPDRVAVSYSSWVQQPVQATAVPDRYQQTRYAASSGRMQARASSLHPECQAR